MEPTRNGRFWLPGPLGFWTPSLLKPNSVLVSWCPGVFIMNTRRTLVCWCLHHEHKKKPSIFFMSTTRILQASRNTPEGHGSAVVPGSACSPQHGSVGSTPARQIPYFLHVGGTKSYLPSMLENAELLPRRQKMLHLNKRLN